eukprot:comp4980_c0_seq1/m.3983 comp4980_c0_seq1/g.3983  ORF comp4980_c0_seq1/g.3983 comp4980_c0_seq1/m.3983 type:complete len:224 (+) comp4980_c0_seq1:725-1396(+)
MREFAVLLSSPLVGSSRNRIEGRATSSMAMETRRFSPPERSMMGLVRMCAMPRACATLWMSAVRSAARNPAGRRVRAECVRVSSGVMLSKSTRSCGTNPRHGCISRTRISWPLTVMWPSVGITLPERMLSSDVLPAPDGPRMHVTVPAVSLAEMLVSTRLLSPVAASWTAKQMLCSSMSSGWSTIYASEKSAGPGVLLLLLGLLLLLVVVELFVVVECVGSAA